MFNSYEVSYYIYFVIVGIALFYLYKSVRQIKTKNIEFFGKDRYTDESVEKWAVVDGFLKIGAAVAFAVYGGLGLAEINILYITIGVLVIIVVLYFVLYAKTLVKKDED